ncbi:unnamed protein product [Didymodactylos carnosus]|uniref:BTB domain-containing protein n=1 Tax=Didymodactylos carnosus TaxID=1234261 RepID=A0A813S637_9BILA|nr:unnamed protein product [Didymodactylos carnosus]CAF0790065.1 unnamed protein product [Didymodactylos carnosus]CAF3538075.1 unnamed protein product [Didymodactylos carnosus]CAF3574264.1 unnamed protein product [Didymodactylos carnosus]
MEVSTRKNVNLSDCKLNYVCHLSPLSSSVLCDRSSLMLCDYFKSYFNYHQPSNVNEINEYNCKFQFTETTLLFCIKLLHNNNELSFINVDNLEDLLNGMMFLCMDEDYFISVLKVVQKQIPSLVSKEQEHVLFAIEKSQIDTKWKQGFLAQKLYLLRNQDDKRELMNSLFLKTINYYYQNYSCYNDNNQQFILHGDIQTDNQWLSDNSSYKFVHNGLNFQCFVKIYSKNRLHFQFTCKQTNRQLKERKSKAVVIFYTGLDLPQVERVCDGYGSYEFTLPLNLTNAAFSTRFYHAIVDDVLNIEQLTFNFIISPVD